MRRQALRSRRDRVAAVERGRVVRRRGAVVAPAVPRDRNDPPDRETGRVEATEDDAHLARDRTVDDELPAMGTTVEPDVRDMEPAQLRGPDGAASVPGAAE